MSKIWSHEEIDFLEEHIGKMKILTIAKKLNRTETGVLLKMKRLGIGTQKNKLA
jgi:hypothetical protein